MSKKSNRYTYDFKCQIANLVNNGKPVTEIITEYGVARSTIHKWTNDFNKTKSFNAKDNRSDKEKELIALKKELQQLKMENDILKQAALIMAQK